MKLRAIALAAFAALALSACDRGADSSATASRDATTQPSKGGNLAGGLGSKQDGTAAMGASPAASAAAGSGSTNRTSKSAVGQR